jgi:hypothetical protein
LKKEKLMRILRNDFFGWLLIGIGQRGTAYGSDQNLQNCLIFLHQQPLIGGITVLTGNLEEKSEKN